MDRLFGLANVTVTVLGGRGYRGVGHRRRRSGGGAADRHRRAARRGHYDRPATRLAPPQPAVLLVHPVPQPRQLPVLIGSVVLGSASNPVWPLAASGVTVVFGVLRWFHLPHRRRKRVTAYQHTQPARGLRRATSSLGADRGAAVAPAVGVDGAAGGHRPELQ